MPALPRRLQRLPRLPRLTRVRGWRGSRLIALVAALLAGVVVADVGVLVHRVPTFTVHVPTSGGSEVFLLLASDSRQRLEGADRLKYADPVQAQGERADLVYLLRTGGGHDPELLSVPRDLYVGTLTHDPHRLGMTLQLGPQAMVDSMCRDLGVGVDHVVIADFRGLIDAVDAAGGVTVSTAGPMRDLGSGISLSTGSRHPEIFRQGAWVPDISADPTRSSHASQVMRQLAGDGANPLTAQLMAWSAAPRLRRDSSMSPVTLARLVWGLRQATAYGNVSTVPARFSRTEVPVAFINAQSRAALAPFHSATCQRDSSAH
jgi:polyisoprenyl-teichoic acid--peptidoglycan teichoic acid transferase